MHPQPVRQPGGRGCAVRPVQSLSNSPCAYSVLACSRATSLLSVRTRPSCVTLTSSVLSSFFEVSRPRRRHTANPGRRDRVAALAKCSEKDRARKRRNGRAALPRLRGSWFDLGFNGPQVGRISPVIVEAAPIAISVGQSEG